MNVHLAELKTSSLFADLTDQELCAIRQGLLEKKFKKGELLFLEEQGCQRIFIIRKGRVKMYRTTSSGKEQILEILESSDTCACNPGRSQWPCMATAEALTDTEVWFIPKEHFVQLIKTYPGLSLALNRILSDRLRCYGNLIEEVSLKDVKKRLIKFLLDQYQKKQKNNTLTLPGTREEIAQRIGTARETVIRYLHQLQDENLIVLKGHSVTIKDIEALKTLIS